MRLSKQPRACFFEPVTISIVSAGGHCYGCSAFLSGSLPSILKRRQLAMFAATLASAKESKFITMRAPGVATGQFETVFHFHIANLSSPLRLR